MRTRFVVLATVLSALMAVSAPGVASAAPSHNHGLTISSTPNPIIAGQGVLIYGQLNGSDNASQTISLYHRIVPARRFTLIQRTRTNGFGFYYFTRADGVVVTNRYWYVRGPDATHSRTIEEHVAALVSLAATSVPGTTLTPVTGQTTVLSGHVTPSHPFQKVLIQEQNSVAGNGWSTIATTFTGPGSNFTVPHRWAQAGIYTLRAVCNGDARNTTGDSDLVTVTIQQKQNVNFTINSSSPTVTEAQPVTISGVLYKAGSSTATTPGTPLKSTQVTLYGKTSSTTWTALGTVVTGTDGSYSFLEDPIHNTAYKVQVTLKPSRTTAVLYEGAQDVVTIAGSGYQTATVGETITLTGTVAPDHTGHVIYLQSESSDGSWHNVQAGIVASGSTYSFPYTFGQAGTFDLRARIYGGPENVGAASQAVTVAVSGVAPISTLSPAS